MVAHGPCPAGDGVGLLDGWASLAAAPPVKPTRVLFVAADGTVHAARTLEAPRLGPGEKTKLLTRGAGPARLEVVEAEYSADRRPGTWSRVVETAS